MAFTPMDIFPKALEIREKEGQDMTDGNIAFDLRRAFDRYNSAWVNNFHLAESYYFYNQDTSLLTLQDARENLSGSAPWTRFSPNDQIYLLRSIQQFLRWIDENELPILQPVTQETGGRHDLVDGLVRDLDFSSVVSSDESVAYESDFALPDYGSVDFGKLFDAPDFATHATQAVSGISSADLLREFTFHVPTSENVAPLEIGTPATRKRKRAISCSAGSPSRNVLSDLSNEGVVNAKDAEGTPKKDDSSPPTPELTTTAGPTANDCEAPSESTVVFNECTDGPGAQPSIPTTAPGENPIQPLTWNIQVHDNTGISMPATPDSQGANTHRQQPAHKRMRTRRNIHGVPKDIPDENKICFVAIPITEEALDIYNRSMPASSSTPSPAVASTTTNPQPVTPDITAPAASLPHAASASAAAAEPSTIAVPHIPAASSPTSSPEPISARCGIRPNDGSLDKCDYIFPTRSMDEVARHLADVHNLHPPQGNSDKKDKVGCPWIGCNPAQVSKETRVKHVFNIHVKTNAKKRSCAFPSCTRFCEEGKNTCKLTEEEHKRTEEDVKNKYFKRQGPPDQPKKDGVA